jgi:Flp pilus assembly protein TadD
MTGATEDAIAALRHAISLAPDDASPHYQLARALTKQGDKSGAAEEMKVFARLKKSAGETGGMATGRVR